MTALVINGDTSGSVTLQVPAAAGSGTVHTLPAATGTVMVSGNMPAFSVYKSGDQSISSASWTKVTFTDEEFDTNGNFSSSRFTANVAGYYQINWNIDCYGTSCIRQAIALYKNGTRYKYSGFWNAPSGTYETQVGGSSVVYMNGTTDYVEIYAYITGTSPTIYSAAEPPVTYFNGCLLRAA